MVELEPDFLLPAEPVKAGGVAFDLEVRHFQGDRLAGLAVSCLEKRGHPTLGNYVGDLEALVEQAPYAQCMSGPSFAPGARGLGRSGGIDIPHLYDLRGNVVADLPFLGQGNQPFTGFSRMVFHRRFEDLLIQDEPV